MAKLVILDPISERIVTINVGHTALGRLEDIYHDDVADWFDRDGHEDKFNINLSCCQWQFVEDESLMEEHTI